MYSLHSTFLPCLPVRITSQFPCQWSLCRLLKGEGAVTYSITQIICVFNQICFLTSLVAVSQASLGPSYCYALGLFPGTRASEMINIPYSAAQEVGSFYARKRGQRAGKGNIFPTRVPGGYMLWFFSYMLELAYWSVDIFQAKLLEYNFIDLLKVNFIIAQFIFKTNTFFETTWIL